MDSLRIFPMSLVATLVAAFTLIACDNAKEHTAPPIYDTDSVSMMTSYGINTLISDSGVIKYRIVAESWDVNTVRQPSRWTFIKGIFMEQFDEKFHIEAYIHADTAWYYDQRNVWHLRGRVHIRNVNGLIYDSEELFWDGNRHEFYSNVYSKVITPERTMEGTTFRSDERMTHYFVTNSAGSFTKDDAFGNDSTSTQTTEQPDTTAVIVPLRDKTKPKPRK